MLRYGIIAAAMLLPLAADAAAPEETLAAPGLSQPVEILRDRWGISHIYAQNENDLFFAQGYNAARDRLFQLEVWRRQATGTLAEILGPRELKRDIANRLFMYRGDLGPELNWYHPHGAAIAEAFVRGINAYIDQTAKDPALLSAEFKMLGIKPGKWTPAVVISRFNGLRGNLDEEMNTALAVRDIGAEAVSDTPFKPAHVCVCRCPIVLLRKKKRDIDGGASCGGFLYRQVSFLGARDLDEDVRAIRPVVQPDR